MANAKSIVFGLTLGGLYLLVGGCGNGAISVLVVLQPLRDSPEVEALVRICPTQNKSAPAEEWGDVQGGLRRTAVEGHVVRAAGRSLLVIPLVRALRAEPLRPVRTIDR